MQMNAMTPPPAAPILVIEDDPAFGPFVCAFLESKGFDAQLATSGAAALAMFAAINPCLVITDIYVPSPDGIEIIKFMLNNQPGIPIIAMSGTSDSSFLYLRVARTLGARAILEKPFSGAELLHTIKQLLGTLPAAN